jgi:isoleucyl-tRNA synthetase
VNIKVRQPLSKLMVPVTDNRFEEQLKAVSGLILSEVNVKEIEFLKDTAGILVKKVKPNFKTLGPRYGKVMKQLAAAIAQLGQDAIADFEAAGEYSLSIEGQEIQLSLEDVEIVSEDIPGWLVANEGKLTVALDVEPTPELRQEGIAREFVNRIQNLRKDKGLEVTDKIRVKIVRHAEIDKAVENFGRYIGEQTLAERVELVTENDVNRAEEVNLDDEIRTLIQIDKI